jgi:hypothetical protein
VVTIKQRQVEQALVSTTEAVSEKTSAQPVAPSTQDLTPAPVGAAETHNASLQARAASLGISLAQLSERAMSVALDHASVPAKRVGTLSLVGEEQPNARGATLESLLNYDPKLPQVRTAMGSMKPEDIVQFGFESEYGLDEIDRLLLLYTPTEAAGITDQTFRGWTKEQRSEWVENQIPKRMLEPHVLPLKKATDKAELQFIPEQLVIDTTKNVEIIVPPTNTLETVLGQVKALGESCGVGSLQGTLSAPRELMFGGDSPRGFTGFFNFHHLADSFAKLTAGYTKYREEPTRPPVASFAHPWLGPITKAKQHFMRVYLEKNAVGERLDKDSLMAVRRNDSSFKYIGGSAYRPDVAAHVGRTAVEVRDCHKSERQLKERLLRNTWRFVAGPEVFDKFADVKAFDTIKDYDKLPQEVRDVLPQVIPTSEKPELADVYGEFERLALQVYRNFAYPMKDFSDVIAALGTKSLTRQVDIARDAYVSTLSDIAKAVTSGETTKKQAAIEIQGALAQFGVDSGIADALQSWEKRNLVPNKVDGKAMQMEIDGVAPLTNAFPADAWSGDLSKRINKLTRRWPDNVTLDGSTLTIKLAGLSEAKVAELSRDKNLAFARGTVGKVGEQLRVGAYTFSINAEAMDAQKTTLVAGQTETVATIKTMQEFNMRKHVQLAARFFETSTNPSAFFDKISLGPQSGTVASALAQPAVTIKVI